MILVVIRKDYILKITLRVQHISIGDARSDKYVQLIILGSPSTFFYGGQIFVLVAMAILE